MKKIIGNPLTWIFIIAMLLRIFKLESFPVGFQEDEIKAGWNAISIMETGLDDHLKAFSLYYNTFGDYRPTGIFYFSIPFIMAFGRTIFAVRFSSALFGALSVFPIYLLTNLIPTKKTLPKKFILTGGHIAAFLLAISPWHIDASRATSESVISTFFALFAIYYFIVFIKSANKKYIYYSLFNIIVSSLLYHSIRLLAPFFYLTTLVFFYKEIKKRKLMKQAFLTFVIVSGFSTFLLTNFGGQQRFSQVSIFADPDVRYEIGRVKNENAKHPRLYLLLENKITIYAKHFAMEYGKYFSSDFLIGYSAKPYRYIVPGTSLLNYIEILFLLLGITAIIKAEKSLFPLLLLVIAPVSAAFTSEDAPNLQRAMMMLPLLIIIESYGIETFISWKRKLAAKAAVLTLFVFAVSTLVFCFIYIKNASYHAPYIYKYPIDSPTYRNEGYSDLTNKLVILKGQYNKIIITNFSDNFYPWYAFFTNQKPKIFNRSLKEGSNERVFENIVFSDIKCPSDLINKDMAPKTLVIDSGDCDYKSQLNAGMNAIVVDKILRSDGTEVFVLLESI